MSHYCDGRTHYVDDGALAAYLEYNIESNEEKKDRTQYGANVKTSRTKYFFFII